MPAHDSASTRHHVVALSDTTPPLPPTSPDEPQVVCCGHEVAGLAACGSDNPAPRYLARDAGHVGGPARLVPRRGRLFYLGAAIREVHVAHHYALSDPGVLLNLVVESPDGGPETARVIPWRLLPDPLARTLDGILMRERDRE